MQEAVFWTKYKGNKNLEDNSVTKEEERYLKTNEPKKTPPFFPPPLKFSTNENAAIQFCKPETQR